MAFDKPEENWDITKFNFETATAYDLARYSAVTASQSEDPHLFWGDSYGQVIKGSEDYINSIGLEEAKRLFKEGKLNFPETVYKK